MSVSVRVADLESEKKELFDVLKRNLGELEHARRFDWLYRANPAGAARTWFVCEEDTQRVVGVASLFSRVMRVNGKEILCGQVGDFAIDAGHRSLGPAMMLQRATFEPVNQGQLAFCYDCPPHASGMSTFRRLGMEPNCRMQRFARPLRAERLVEKRFGENLFSNSAAAVVNVILRTMQGRTAPAKNIEIAVHSGRFCEEFKELEERVKSRDAISSRRSPADLNWRYRDDPLNAYEVLVARVRGQLAGYAVFSMAGSDAYIVDLFDVGIESTGLELIEAVAHRCRREGLQTLQALISEGSELSGVLAKANFRYRSSGPLVVAYAQKRSLHTFLSDSANWRLQQAELLA